MRDDEPRLVWTSLTTTLMNAGERDSVWKEGGEKKGSACEENCESESNPKPSPRPKPSSADVAERGMASIGVRSSGNLCVDEEYA